jgi:hypothetical protein
MTITNYDRVCSRCTTKESDTVKVYEILMPPQIVARTQYCESCLDIILDNERNKKADIK